MYNEPSKKVEKRSKKSGDANRGIAQIGKMTARTMGGSNAQEVNIQNDDDEPEQPQLSIYVAMLTLGVSTALVAVCAEFMVDSISALTATGGISETFVGLILLPIVGNAAEHATAVTVACKDKMDLAIGVAVGSSMQIALLVLPFIVVLGWIMGKDDMVGFHPAPGAVLACCVCVDC
jgi:Ca2+:H+ antiporter